MPYYLQVLVWLEYMPIMNRVVWSMIAKQVGTRYDLPPGFEPGLFVLAVGFFLLYNQLQNFSPTAG